MSATSEQLAEELRLLDESISKGETSLSPEIQEKRKQLLERLSAANSALNEGKGILKG